MKYYQLIFAVILFSCNNKKATKHNFPDQVSSIADAQAIVRVVTEPMVIKIDMSKIVEGKFEDYFRRKEIIYLDDKSPLGNISKIEQHDSLLLVLDSDSSNQLFCFDTEGKLQWEFKDKGKGPLEYASLSDFAINVPNGTVDVMDNKNYKIIRLDLMTGKPITEFKLGFFGYEFVAYDANKFLVYTGNFTYDNKLRYKLMLVDDQRNVYSRNLFIPKKQRNKRYLTNKSFHQNKETIFFTETLNDTIYTIKNDTLRTKYFVDFLDKKYPSELLNNFSIELLDKLRKERPFVSAMKTIWEIGDNLFITFPYASNYYTAVYNTKTKSTNIFERLESIEDPIHNEIYFNQEIDGSLLRVVQPYIIHSGKIKDNKTLMAKLKNDYPMRYEMITTTSLNSNPILILYDYTFK